MFKISVTSPMKNYLELTISLFNYCFLLPLGILQQNKVQEKEVMVGNLVI